MSPLPAIVIGLSGNFLLSLGMVLQKRHVAWMGYKGRRDAAFRRDLLGWLLGFILMNVAPVTNYFALLGLAANVVSALIGADVAFTALLVAFFLKEKLGGAEIAWTAVLFVALGLAGFRGGSPSPGFSLSPYLLFYVLPVAVGLVTLLSRWRLAARDKAAPDGGAAGAATAAATAGAAAAGAAGAGAKPRHGKLAVVFACVAGAFGGYMVLTMRALQLAAGNDLIRWLSTPYLYLYVLGGILSFVTVQLAYKDGSMGTVSPAFYGMQVLWPALASYAVLGAAFDALQAAAFAAIALSIFMISRKG
jgi:drug/metabolite transporter (DMT)-like permease